MDKFYTNDNVVSMCISHFKEKYSFEAFELIVEPSAGDGAFLKYLPDNTLAIDLYPEAEGIEEQDYLTWDLPEAGDILVIGNPPFGKNSALAKRFFNVSAAYAKVIAFILPKTVKKLTMLNSLDLRFHLQSELTLPLDSFTEFGKPKKVPCVFQIWEKQETKRTKLEAKTTHKDFSFVRKEEADFAIRRVGGLAGKVLDEFGNYASSSNYFICASEEVKIKMVSLYSEFQDIASNTAGNPSLSKSELVYLYSKEFDNG